MCEHHYYHHHEHRNLVHLLGKHTELYFALLSGVFVSLGYVSACFSLEYCAFISYISAFLFGGFFTVQGSFFKLRRGSFEIDFLMFVAACGAAFLGKWAEGALLLFLFSLGHALEHYALGKAEKAIAALGKLTPDVAWIKKGNEFEEISVRKLKKGDVILVKAHEQIAADGVVVFGKSVVNQSSITGESMPVDKLPIAKGTAGNDFEKISDKHRVFAGTLNGNSPIEVRVLRLATQSTVARMIKMVSEAQVKQSPTQRFTKRIERFYVPGVLILVLVLCFVFLWGGETFSASFYRAITVLVASSPCALAISTPGTVLSGIARGAQKGILFKGGGVLEDLGSVSAIAFDKTGTLTQGRPQVVAVVPYQISEKEFLTLAMSLEAFSQHPLARAIFNYAKSYLKPLKIEGNTVKVWEGKGIEATIAGEMLQLGKLSFLKQEVPEELKEKIESLKSKGYTLVGLGNEKQFLGVIALSDKPKPTAAKMLADLRKLGIEKLVMLTGDQQTVADTVGKELKMKEVIGGLLPEEKVAAIRELNVRFSKTAMIGDGVNDAPAMATSTVAIAMGAAGSDVALETAGIALLSDNIEQIPFAVGLSRKTKKIITQNLFISLGSIALLIPMAIFNVTGIGLTVLLHEGTTILVILNALRLLNYHKMKS